MQQHRFDDLTRSLGATNSRRTVLKGLLAGAVGGVVAAVSGGGALAAKGGNGRGHHKPDCCPDDHPTFCVDSYMCVDTDGDPNNCGGCGTICPVGETCASGTCVTSGECTPGTQQGCSTGLLGVCATGTQTCTSASTWGECVQTVFPQTEVCNGLDDDCNGVVDDGFDLLTDPLNCGTCGHVCNTTNATVACVNGTCEIAACNEGFGDCNSDPSDGCETNILGDPNNCGVCGNVCAAGETCVSGTCESSACTSSNICITAAIDPATGNCVLTDAPSGVVCEPDICVNADTVRTCTCDGAGNCVCTSASCAPYHCVNDACATVCSTDFDCVTGFYCSAAECVQQLGIGSSCTAADQCTSGFCTNGVCSTS